MNVYDFKGKGVAMSMYNTDEVRTVAPSEEKRDANRMTVDLRLCTLFLQDGVAEEDASGVCSFFLNPLPSSPFISLSSSQQRTPS